jgi:hypothetical protein
MSLLKGLRNLWQRPEAQRHQGQAHTALGATGTDVADPVLGRVGMSYGMEPSTYRLQQSYDALIVTVQQLRETLDGQTQIQQEFLARMATIPHAAEALPQTSQMQTDMLRIINDRLTLHAQQQQKLNDVMAGVTKGKDHTVMLQAIREQIEMSNEIDRQLVESFNRFSLMLDRLQQANSHAVECLEQLRDSYTATSMQVEAWVDKSRRRRHWLVGVALIMSGLALGAVSILIYALIWSQQQ